MNCYRYQYLDSGPILRSCTHNLWVFFFFRFITILDAVKRGDNLQMACVGVGGYCASKGWETKVYPNFSSLSVNWTFSENSKIRVESNLTDRLKVTTLCSQEATKIVQPVLLGYLLRYFETYDPNDYHGLELACYYALGMSLCLLLLAVMHHILFFNTQKAGMKIRVAMCNMIFRKVSLFDGPWAEWVGLETGCRLPSVG